MQIAVGQKTDERKCGGGISRGLRSCVYRQTKHKPVGKTNFAKNVTESQGILNESSPSRHLVAWRHCIRDVCQLAAFAWKDELGKRQTIRSFNA